MPQEQVYDSQKGQVVASHETSSGRIRNKLRNPYNWCFCELCSNTTEFSIAIDNPSIFKRKSKDNLVAVQLTETIRKEAQQMANLLVERYEKALKLNSSDVSSMLFAHCDMIDMGGDHSVTSFREQVERRAIYSVWARHGDMLGKLQLPKHPEGAAKPSKLYCENHNSRRSDQARRNYQNDRRYCAEYQECISIVAGIYAGSLPFYDIAVQATIRRDAYKLLLATKKTIRLIDKYRADGNMNLTQIARKIDKTRQAISIAIKRHSKDDIHKREEHCKELTALYNKFSVAFNSYLP